MSRTSPLRVAFQGEPGAFSEVAAHKLLGRGIRTVPCPTFDALFRSVRDKAADCILVPLENSLAGALPRNYDLLLASRLFIVGEVVLPIAHHLIGCRGARLRDITAVYSHPVALAQCERFFAAHPRIARVAAADTAGSVREVVTRGVPSRAALAGAYAAARYGGQILKRHLEDHRKNLTRFVLAFSRGRGSCALSPAGGVPPMLRFRCRRAPYKGDKLSLALELPHRPGALCRALQVVANARFNLLKIESRPIAGSPWEYRFYIDVAIPRHSPTHRQGADGQSRWSHDSDAVMLWDFIHALKGATTRLRVLGHYPTA